MATTLIDIVRERAAELGDSPLFTFLTDGDAREETRSYRQIDTRARAVAVGLVNAGLAGERVVLLYPPCLEYIAAFLGCIYAGAIAVPAYPPNPARLQRTLPRLRKLVERASAAALLTTSQLREMSSALSELAPELAQKRWIASDEIRDSCAESWKRPDLTPESIAFLQYTSGSTGTPKGVVLTHDNLIHNEQMIHRAFAHDRALVGVGWLPLYHDMGLIGNVLATIHAGGRCILFSPLDFLAEPHRWLSAISRYRGTTSGGPNFAYEMCVQKITPAQRETLDLSSWKVAFNGSEPVRASTLERFHETFSPHGFRKEAFLPCYGLAEASLIVSGRSNPEGPTIATFDVTKLEIGNRAVETTSPDGRRLVGCGPPAEGLVVRIVDATAGVVAEDGDIGEVWVAGGSVSSGYYDDEEATRDTFGATLPDAPGMRFLRTGDLGFFGPRNELFIAGRVKDLLILRGRNYYPQDIERIAEAAHHALRPGCSAAFAIDDGEDVGVAVIAEYDTKKAGTESDLDDAIAKIREAIGDEHELRVPVIALLKPGEIPKTSSGKVMRSAARRAFEEGKLVTLRSSREALPGARSQGEARAPVAAATEAEIVGFILDWFANPAITEASIEKSLDALGLDSAGAVRLASSLSKWLGRKVPPTIFWDYPTISSLAKFLSGAG